MESKSPPVSFEDRTVVGIIDRGLNSTSNDTSNRDLLLWEWDDGGCCSRPRVHWVFADSPVSPSPGCRVRAEELILFGDFVFGFLPNPRCLLEPFLIHS